MGSAAESGSAASCPCRRAAFARPLERGAAARSGLITTVPLTRWRSARDEALPTALVAAHLIIGVEGGQFVSMIDPPEWGEAGEVEACQNVGCWPVLGRPGGGRQVMLSTPIMM